MSAGTVRDRQFSGRRENEESEPFLVREIPGSPVRRGRRIEQEVVGEDDRFTIENMSASPLMRSRVPKLLPSGRSHSTTISNTGPSAHASSSTRTSTIEGPTRPIDTVDGSTIGSTVGTVVTSSRVTAVGSVDVGPPNNDDAPPSYESSLPQSTIGWSSNDIAETHRTTTIMPMLQMAHLVGQNDGLSGNAIPYALYKAYPNVGLSPIAESYRSDDAARSKSAARSTSPSLCPSSDSCRPAYTYQYGRIVPTAPPRPRYGFDHDVSITKPRNDFSYRYGAIVIAIAFVAFLMLLSLAVKFLIRNGFSR